MSRPIGFDRAGQRWGLILVVLIGALLVTARSAAAEPEEESPPVISNGLISPWNLPLTGGEVEIRADITDDGSVDTAYAELIGSDGNLLGVTLEGTGGNGYAGHTVVPANNSEWPVYYSVWIGAMDNEGRFVSEVIGDLEVQAAPPFDEAPYLSEPSVSPTLLPAAGGGVTIQATASDNRSVSEVFATIQPPGGSPFQTVMEPISFNRFQAVQEIPDNLGASAQQYGVTITAVDDIGQSTTIDAEDVTVAGYVPSGPLTVNDTQRHFGIVPVGGHSRRWLFIRNAGHKGSPRVEVRLDVSDSPFALPGKVKTLTIKVPAATTRRIGLHYWPTEPGRHLGLLSLRRTDGAQSIDVGLVGRAVGG